MPWDDIPWPVSKSKAMEETGGEFLRRGKRHRCRSIVPCVCGRLASGYVKKSCWAKLRNLGISGLAGTSAALYHYSVFAGAGAGSGAAGAAGTSGAGAGVASAGAAGSSGAGFSDLR